MRKIAAMLSAGVLGAVVGLNCNSDVLGGGEITRTRTWAAMAVT